LSKGGKRGFAFDCQGFMFWKDTATNTVIKKPENAINPLGWITFSEY
jgi:hypothetical protein